MEWPGVYRRLFRHGSSGQSPPHKIGLISPDGPLSVGFSELEQHSQPKHRMGTPLSGSMDSLRWASSHGSSAALQRCSGIAGPSHRVTLHPRCGARAGADGQSKAGRAPEPVRAAAVQAPEVSEGGQANKQGDIREQAHRRGTGSSQETIAMFCKSYDIALQI